MNRKGVSQGVVLLFVVLIGGFLLVGGWDTISGWFDGVGEASGETTGSVADPNLQCDGIASVAVTYK